MSHEREPVNYDTFPKLDPLSKESEQQETGPCSCQDEGRCRYVNGGPACMNEPEGSSEKHSERPTPRTDAAELDYYNAYSLFAGDVKELFRKMRQLERELAEAAQSARPTMPPPNWPRARGISRLADAGRAVGIAFDRRPTDDELREIHDFLRGPIDGRSDAAQSASGASLNSGRLVSVIRQGSSVGPIIGCRLRLDDGSEVEMAPIARTSQSVPVEDHDAGGQK